MLVVLFLSRVAFRIPLRWNRDSGLTSDKVQVITLFWRSDVVLGWWSRFCAVDWMVAGGSLEGPCAMHHLAFEMPLRRRPHRASCPHPLGRPTRKPSPASKMGSILLPRILVRNAAKPTQKKSSFQSLPKSPPETLRPRSPIGCPRTRDVKNTHFVSVNQPYQ